MMSLEEKIEQAVRRKVSSWDLDSLVEYVVEDLFNYYYNHADPDDLETLMKEEGNTDD